MNDLEARYADQLELLGVQMQALGFDVALLHMDDGHPAPGLRIHIADETAELVCLFSPLAEIEGLEDLDLLNVVLSRNEDCAAQRQSVEAVITAANELCPFGHFALRDDGMLYYRAEYVTEYDELPEITSFADSLKLMSYADVALRPAILEAASGGDTANIIADMRS